MQQTIYLAEVLEIMRTPNEEGRAVKFSIAYRTYNRQSKKGGIMKRYENAKLVMQEKGNDPTSVEALKRKHKKVDHRKNPKHFENKTRNIRLESGIIKKVNINNIIEFNGKKVQY